MRYYKGYITISDERDIPVLLHIRNARAVSFDQLCGLLQHDEIETLRRSVHWRVSRLEKARLIERFEQDRFLGQPVFAITPLGLALLESRGQYMVALPSTTERVIHRSQLFHALELVNIRLSLARNGILRSWKTEVEITSRNLVLEHSNAKDYDAVVEVSIAGESRIFAIEYERTAKASARYKEIRELLSSDKTVETVLYLTSNHDVLYLLAVELRGVAKQIGIALSDQFRRDILKTQTLRVGAADDVIEFRDLIAQ
jgi:hypothetical protein